ncbi:MAG TPA: low molecular weight protein-tyrosine-phosphatase [Flavobacterium sp.]|jgi:protein-tyrosine phosphatase
MPVKILMVCLGNICRSPLAEGILRAKLPEKDFIIDSAGTGDYHIGRPPDKRSIAIAREKGLDITAQKARQFTAKDFKDFDIIYVMDQSNYTNVLRFAPNEEAKKKVSLILNELFPGENVDVPDPFYGLENGFNSVYDMLDEACDSIAKKLTQKKRST